ncbi:hypothetical protein [Aquabacterium sp. CECT 9606]|uniref:hypothetical protein n=1 Tax=Aquabacterium sp. CECT 9606 TaxID=2845822 RepID=UPI001E558EA6|nr:hypothetical protein [Aquabacterium sp. CECT 9606]CAH0348084.1 hypothetical protein AQB9606_00305 [Aquabacterium sp. CECT 9606]
MIRQRSRNLTPEDVELIVSLLDGWGGALTWKWLIDNVERRLFFRYTRQALHAHQRIQDAFKLCKERLARAPRKPGEKHVSPEMRVLMERLARRDAEVERLKAENQRLMEQFVVWLYNAQIKAVSLADLKRPLPRVDRGQTKSELRVVGSGRRPSRT